MNPSPQAVEAAARALLEFHDSPPEAKRPDIFAKRIEALRAELSRPVEVVGVTDAQFEDLWMLFSSYEAQYNRAGSQHALDARRQAIDKWLTDFAATRSPGVVVERHKAFGCFRRHPDENGGIEFFHSALWHNDTLADAGERIVEGYFVAATSTKPAGDTVNSAASGSVQGVASEVIDFLMGVGPLEGCHFGEKPATERGNFWWRKHLRASIASSGGKA